MPVQLPAITFEAQRARTMRNEGACEMAVGIMNLTDAEVARLRSFVNQLSYDRTRAPDPDPRSAPEPRFSTKWEREEWLRTRPGERWTCRNGHPLETGTSWCYECVAEAKRERYGAPASSGRAPVNVVDLARDLDEKFKEPGNRFSGLDIPESEQ